MELYACGSNQRGQLGVGHNDDVLIPEKVDLPVELPPTARVQVVGGGNYTMLCYDHKVFVAGYLECVGLEGMSNTFVPLPLSFDCTAVAAGWEFSAFLSSEGDCYVAGFYGALSLICSKEVSKLSFPSDFGKACKIWASQSRIIVQDENGAICAWGNLRNIEKLERVEWSPKRVNSMDGALQVGLANRFVLTLDPKLEIRWFGNFKSCEDVRDVPVSSNSELMSGWTSCAVKTGSKVLVVGNNSHGQCTVPPKSFSAVAAGSEHYLGIETGTNAVCSWGWGEHGNNPPSEAWPQDKTATQIAAGCATSFAFFKN